MQLLLLGIGKKEFYQLCIWNAGTYLSSKEYIQDLFLNKNACEELCQPWPEKQTYDGKHIRWQIEKR